MAAAAAPAAKADPNNIEAVGIPVTGKVAVADYGTALPTAEAGGKDKAVLDAKFQELGLVTTDGGPEWTIEADGDAIEFWQEGYTIPSGLANVEVKIILAQTDKRTQEFLRGIKYDTNNHMVVDGAGRSSRFAIWVEEIFKNGTIRRRGASNAMIKSVSESKSERGSVLGYEVTIGILAETNSAGGAGGHFHEWLINPTTTTATSS